MQPVFSDAKGKGGGCHALYFAHVGVFTLSGCMMWKNSDARFNVLWRRWFRVSEGEQNILLFQAKAIVARGLVQKQKTTGLQRDKKYDV